MEIEYLTMSEQGQRNYNEDALLADTDNGIFMVCDGVGGSNRGDIASKKACEYFSDYVIRQNEVSEIVLEQALVETEMKFDEYTSGFPEAKGMATTLTFLKITPQGAIAGHIGDSRIYQIRNGEIIFMTQDHSFVNELVASGFLTEEEAVNHPKKNQITRAIQGSESSTLIDFGHIESIEKNDFFMLCSDGILEGIDKDWISENFKSKFELSAIEKGIRENCAEKSNDNYTAILIKITEI